MPFCHLHTHSQYSILDSTLSLAGIVKKAAADGMPAVALTDHGNLFGAVDFYKIAKGAGIKPIIGCEMNLASGSRTEKKRGANATHITLLAKNQEGYANLIELSSRGYTEGFYYVPRIDMELLRKHSNGLICLSGCIKGPLSSALLQKNAELFESLLSEFLALFKDDFYFEIQRHFSTKEDLELDGVLDESWLFQQYQELITQQKLVEKKFVATAAERGIPIVATQNCHYGEREEWRAHEILLNVQSGEPCQLWHTDPETGEARAVLNPKRTTFPSHEYYMKTTQEMEALFHDIPEALAESVRIAGKCSLELDFKTKHYPVFYPPHIQNRSISDEARIIEVHQFLRKLCDAGIEKRYTAERLQKVAELYPNREPMQVVKERLEYELHIITSKGMSDYILIVWDFINWAKRNGIPMGPGRGSGAGSIILYLIEITDIEPLRFHLFFERFINPERVSYPDIDVDICMDRRQEVIQYTIDTYGKENVAQIITFGTMKAKMSVKDVGRVLNIPLAKVTQIAKLIPDDLNITIEKALEKDPDLRQLYETDSDAKNILSVAKTLEGSIRNTGLHAAGLIVSGEPLMRHIPITVAKDSDMYVTQYSMKPVEMVGMLKIDFLGLKTLTSIQIAIASILERTGQSIDWINLPLDDGITFDLLNQGKTLGIFQLESGGMQDLAKQLHLDKFEEIIAVLSLYRPGPMDMIPSFIARKHGVEAIEYDHPWLEPILQETYGIMVYQEQVMQIASRLANYSLGEGDVLRRAMGKKDMKEMAKQRDKFLAGAQDNSIDSATAGSIFDKMEKFAEYGFNKSHAAAYGYVTYVTAYLKANYPGDWLSSLMTCDKDDTEKASKFMHEAFLIGIPCLPPDINESGMNFRYTGSGIRFALSAIKGVGTQVVESIIEERRRGGVFSSFKQFFERLDPKKVGKKVVELLIDAGAFAGFSQDRDQLIASVEPLYEQASKKKKEATQGILSLFDSCLTETTAAPIKGIIRTKEELLFREKQLLGLFISGHPLDEYKAVLEKLGTISIAEALRLPDGSLFRMAFVVDSLETKISSKNQKKFAILQLSDTSDEVLEMPLWAEMYEKYQPIAQENSILWGVFSKELRLGSSSSQISCRWLSSIKGVDVKKVEESEAVYDKVKHQMQKGRQFGSNSKAGEAKTGEKKAAQPKPAQEKAASAEKKPKCMITLDLAALRASHTIQIKKALLEHSQASPDGAIPISISFSRNGQEAASIELKSGAAINAAAIARIKTALASVRSIISIEQIFV